jgi:D-ribose pyranase
MNNSGILNPAIRNAIANLRHTDYFSVVDVGTPVPGNANVIDISFVNGLPPFLTVLEAVLNEMVVESCFYAREIGAANPQVLRGIKEMLGDIGYKEISHEELKRLIAGSKTILRTGECTQFANIVLVGGVNF